MSLLALTALALFAAACGDPSPAPSPASASASAEPLFLVHTSLPGLAYANVSGAAEQLSVLEQNGQGIAILDFDGDGLMDLFATNGGTLQGLQTGDLPGSRLYRNLGDWRFEDVTARAGLTDDNADDNADEDADDSADREVDHGFWATGAAAADYDADGDIDLYVTGFGANRLFRNEGDGRFSDVSESSGVAEERWSSSAVFADFDGDGLLDLYVSNYVAFDPDRVPDSEADGSPCLYRGVASGCGPWRYRGDRDTLYLQARGGPFVRFVEASSAWGLAVSDGFRGMGIAPGDFDRDGDVDLYIGCDVMPNLYLENLSGRGFRSAGRERGLAVNAEGEHESGMGVVAVDLFDRGRLDLLTTNFAGEKNTYYRFLGSGDPGAGQVRFEDQSSRIGFDGHRRELGWGIVAGDFDGDGRRDVFVANGQIYPQVEQLGDPEDSYRQLPRIYLGSAGGAGTAARSVTPDGSRDDASVSSPASSEPRLREAAPERVLRLARSAGSCPAGSGAASCLAFSLRAAAAGDLDNDGDIDIVAIQHNGPLVVFENRSQRPAAWVTLLGRGGGASPHGARIEIAATSEMRGWSHDHWPTSGYQSSHDPRVPLPRSRAAVARVSWSDGACEEFTLPSQTGTVVWREGNGARRCGAAVAD